MSTRKGKSGKVGRRRFLKGGGVTLLAGGMGAAQVHASSQAQARPASGAPSDSSLTPDLLFAVIFEVKPNTEGYQAYLDTAQALRPKLEKIDGFVSVERFTSQTRPGWLLSLSYWADEAALVKWRTEESHHAAQEKGRDGLFDDYRLRVAQVVSREEGGQPFTTPSHPARRSAYNDVTRRRPSSVVLVDVTLPEKGSDLMLAAIEALTTAAQRQPEYQGGDVFGSLAAAVPRIVHLTSWRDEASATSWRQWAHTELGKFGSDGWRVAVAEVERDYGLADRAAAPQYFPGVAATRSSTSTSAVEVLRIQGYPSAVMIALHHLAPARGRRLDPGKIVMFVHGATFPSALAAGYRFDHHSWMDDLSEAGFDVWALDFAGYGASDRYPEMRDPANAHGPLGRADAGSRQITEAVRFVCARQGVSGLSLVAHSWGTLPASLSATETPASINRLVLFGPVTRRAPIATSPGRSPDAAPQPAYVFVTTQQQRARFFGYVPAGEAPVLETRHFDPWAQAYLASDPGSQSRVPPAVQIPSGPSSDVTAAWSGTLAYEPSRITCPTLIVRGEWDSVTTYADAQWLYGALSACPLKRDVVISRGTHVMHLERSRYQLYREVQVFLEGRDRS